MQCHVDGAQRSLGYLWDDIKKLYYKMTDIYLSYHDHPWYDTSHAQPFKTFKGKATMDTSLINYKQKLFWTSAIYTYITKALISMRQ